MQPMHHIFRFQLTLILCMTWGMSGQAQLPPGFIRYPVAEGLNPTSITMAPDGAVYITEKNGRIRIVRDEQLLPEPLLSIEVDSANERGLGHLVLHPEFESNGYYYVFYTVPGLRRNRVSRFTAAGDKTVPGSEVVILDLDPTGADIHNGGDMVFGFDGNLYIATGDGSQNWRGEDLGSTNAKVLRVTPDGQPLPDNPWYTLGYLRCNLVYAYGFRNPYTMALHPETGEIFVNDVGAFTWEEINRVERGAFYGWPKVEGPRNQQPVPAEYQDPVYAYIHANNYCAIVGGAFYAPPTPRFPPEYVGRYFFSDYCTGRMHMLDPDSGQDLGVFMEGGNRVIDIEVADDGSMYYLERRGLGDGSQEDNTGTSNGMLWRIVYTGSGAPFIAEGPESIRVVQGESATFTVSALGNAPLSYTWYVDDAEQMHADGPSFMIDQALLAQDGSAIRVTVSNEKGMAGSDPAILRVTDNQRPVPVITMPVADATYRAGDTLWFAGYADDPEEGRLDKTRLTWRIDFHHGTHAHPALNPVHGIADGMWIIPQAGETATDVWYRVTLTAADEDGLHRSTSQDVRPVNGSIHVTSRPPGLIIGLDGAEAATPYAFEGVHGVSRYLSPPQKQATADSIYFFAEWEDGSKLLNREVRTSQAHQTFTAMFDGVRQGSGTGLTAHYYNNLAAEGEPVVVATSPTIDYLFLLQSPHPDINPDFFSIVWRGYLEPVRTGVHTFTAYYDDFIRLTIDGQSIMEDLVPGPGYQVATKYLEAGRLYPIEVYYADAEWSGNISLRWEHASFPQEVIPTKQLYPEDYLTRPDAMGVLEVRRINDNTLEVLTESYRNAEIQLTITDVTGRFWVLPAEPIYAARNIVSLDLSGFPPGLYYLTATEARTGSKQTFPIVKAQ